MYSVKSNPFSKNKATVVIRESEFVFGITPETNDQLASPAELYLGAFAACILKYVERFSIMMKFEYESATVEVTADRISVEYLCGTKWPADGGAGFFEKIKAQGGGRTPELLSAHPSPSKRIENYHTWAKESGYAGTDKGAMSYKEFQKLF